MTHSGQADCLDATCADQDGVDVNSSLSQDEWQPPMSFTFKVPDSSEFIPPASFFHGDYLDIEKAVQDPQRYIQAMASTSPGIVRGNIHSSSHDYMWNDVFKADSWVQSLRREGYRMPFSSLPGAYCEKNNLSATKEPEFVMEEISRLIKTGSLVPVKSKPRCVSPLTVATRLKDDGTKKLRLCWDGSRHVNVLIKDEHLKFADLAVALSLLEPEDYQLSYDLKSAYHHVLLHPDMLDYMGIAVDFGGSTKYYVFVVMAFGIRSAAHALTRVMKVPSAFFASRGIRHSIFLDDGKVNGQSHHEAGCKHQFILDSLTSAGMVIAPDKTDKPSTASQKAQYLGFIIDSKSMTVSASTSKLERVKSLALSALGKQNVPTRHLAQLIGKMVSLLPALGTFTRLLTRSLQKAMQEQVELDAYRGKTTLTAECHHELKLFLDNVDQFNGSSISRESQAIAMKASLDATRDVAAVAGDASAVGTCAYTLGTELESSFKVQAVFTLEERKLSSTRRELLTFLRTLEAKGDSLKKPDGSTRHLLWLTDSRNAVSALTKGSPTAGVQTLAVDIFRRCLDLNVRLYPLHLSRSDPLIEEADEGSRLYDKDDWSIDMLTFKGLQVYQFTVDLFASAENAKVQKFYSRYLERDAAGMDAFSFSWQGEHAWVCPPTKYIIETWRKLQREKLSGVLLVPKWQTAAFWPVLCSDGRHVDHPAVQVSVISPYIRKGSLSNGTMAGRNKFPFLAIHFTSTTSSEVPIKHRCTESGCWKCEG